MDNQQQLAKILEELETETKKQTFYSKMQCLFSLIAACCCFTLLLLGFIF